MKLPRPSSRFPVAPSWVFLAALFACGVAYVFPAELILLDETWAPDIKHNNVAVTVIDTRDGGDATQAKEGSTSVLLENTEGWPNVRFAGAAAVRLEDIVPGQAQVKLWYRTNAWDGQWQLDLWLYDAAAGRPVKVLESVLQGGAQGGGLIADDEWRQAVGTLNKSAAYDQAAQDQSRPAYVWLVPKSGWNKPHRTFVDRIEISAGPGAAPLDSPPPPPPAVTAKPGDPTKVPDWIWWEAEDSVEHDFPSNGYFAAGDAQEREKLSKGAWLQHHESGGRTAKWKVDVAGGGKFAFWCRKFWRHGPFRWRWNSLDWQTCGSGVALADEVAIRQHVSANWVFLGEVELPAGKHTLAMEMLPEAKAAAFDCWLLSRVPFIPDGANQPGTKYNRAEEGWFAFEPGPDAFSEEAWLDLRHLNQRRAGEAGYVQARGMDFVFEKTGQPVRFWAVNASCEFDDRAAARYLARRLAKLGVNLVRVHGAVWDGDAADLKTVDRRYLDRLHYLVKALADEGIYTKISFYFPLWVSMKESYGFPGYKAGEHPYALLFYHPKFQDVYRYWARELMTTPNPYTGKSLADDPAVAILEVVNEDNLLFWTFKPGTSPPRELMGPLEEGFGRWLVSKYGSLNKARAAWGDQQPGLQGDDLAAGRVALYEASRLTGQDWARKSRNEKRAGDQLQFLTEHLRRFYSDTVKYFRQDLGVKCAISATNWRTADQRVLGAVDKYTNLVCDVVDRHAYFSSGHEGEGAAFSLRTGQIYADTTGLRQPDSLTKELQYVGHPHIVSEYNHPMPNRFRAEAPWLAATYGRLSGTDAFFHFALGQADWLKAHTKFSIDSPAVMGQFPATALIFRLGYVKEGPVVSHSAVKLGDLYAFRGAPVAEQENLDELRKEDVPSGGRVGDQPRGLDPLAFYVGQVTMEIAENPGRSTAMDLSRFIDREKQTVRSATGELIWNWGRGAVALNAPHAQGVCGFLQGITLRDVSVRWENEYASLLLVSLDGEPLSTSGRMLLQVMTEDRNYGWSAEAAGGKDPGKRRITSLGAPPIVVRQIAGTVSLKRADAESLRVTALDFRGYPRKELGHAAQIQLLPDCLYYVIQK